MDSRAARRARRSLLRQQNGESLAGTARDDANATAPRTGHRVNTGGGSSQSPIDLTEGDRGTPETVDEDDLCPICQLLLLHPVRTTCGHTLCKTCMAIWAQTSLEAPMVRVDVDEEPVDFDPVSELEARCPMCRTMTSAREDGPRAQQLRSRYPRTWAERLTEDESPQGEEPAEAIQTITVYIGNRHKLVQPSVEEGDLPQNQHEWTFFVKPSRPDIIEEVHFFLHPTFRPTTVVRQRRPYELTRMGWGVFAVDATVVLKAGYSWVSEQARDAPDGAPGGALPLEWMLDFDGFQGRGSMSRLRLKVRNDRDWQAVGRGREELRDEREFGRMVRQYERDGRYEP